MTLSLNRPDSIVGSTAHSTGATCSLRCASTDKADELAKILQQHTDRPVFAGCIWVVVPIDDQELAFQLAEIAQTRGYISVLSAIAYQSAAIDWANGRRRRH